MQQDKQNSYDEIEIDLLKIIKALWKKLWLILFVGALFGGAMFAYKTFTYVPSYQTSAIMYANVDDPNDSTNTSFDALTGTCIAVMNTRKTLEKVSDVANLSIPYSSLSSMISTSTIDKSPLFSITVTGKNPEEITLIANTIADVLPGMVSPVYDKLDVGVVDYALIPVTPLPNDNIEHTIIAAVLGVFLVCGVIAVVVSYKDWKEQQEKKGISS